MADINSINDSTCLMTDLNTAIIERSYSEDKEEANNTARSAQKSEKEKKSKKVVANADDVKLTKSGSWITSGTYRTAVPLHHMARTTIKRERL